VIGDAVISQVILQIVIIVGCYRVVISFRSQYPGQRSPAIYERPVIECRGGG